MNEDVPGDIIPCARWTPDCQGKWDYDGPIVSISTRYWPRGGGFSILTAARHPAALTWEENDARPTMPPQATASIVLNHGEPDEDGHGGYSIMREASFAGETESEVKAAVEVWVKQEVTRLYALLLDAGWVRP